MVLGRLFSIAVLAVALAGCTSLTGVYKRPDTQRVTETGKMETVTDAKTFEKGILQAFPDIPIPASHKIDLEQSVIFTSPSQSMGKIVLTGNGDVDSLYRFFESQMASNGWSMVNAFQSNVSSLYFAKPGRFTAIIIDGNQQSGTTVYMNIGPE
ncbi:MAG: hypothetical protein GC134_04230 [Proteobacteria bacterium]|nr:hypothetical protein [Pseudomonadota bacterium]